MSNRFAEEDKRVNKAVAEVVAAVNAKGRDFDWALMHVCHNREVAHREDEIRTEARGRL